MKALYALYPDPDSAQVGVDNLRAAGAADHDIRVISSEPFEEYEFGRRDKSTWLYGIAGMGGALGLCVGYWLTSATQQAWPLATGGMRIVALWPNLPVMFEMTMLGSILATVTALVVAAGLARSQPLLYDPEVTDGHILVGIENPPSGVVAEFERALLTSPGARLKKL